MEMFLGPSSSIYQHRQFLDSVESTFTTRHSSQWPNLPIYSSPCQANCFGCSGTCETFVDSSQLPPSGSTHFSKWTPLGQATSHCNTRDAYPSPPTTGTQFKHSIPLPDAIGGRPLFSEAARIELAGVLDSPPVMRNDAWLSRPPPSPPPTEPIGTLALPETDGEGSPSTHDFRSTGTPQCLRASFGEPSCRCQGSGEVSGVRRSNTAAMQLLSPISPTWASTDISDSSVGAEESALLSDSFPSPICSAPKRHGLGLNRNCEFDGGETSLEIFSGRDTHPLWIHSPLDELDPMDPEDSPGLSHSRIEHGDDEMLTQLPTPQSPLPAAERRDTPKSDPPDPLLTPWTSRDSADDRWTLPTSPSVASQPLRYPDSPPAHIIELDASHSSPKRPPLPHLDIPESHDGTSSSAESDSNSFLHYSDEDLAFDSDAMDVDQGYNSDHLLLSPHPNVLHLDSVLDGTQPLGLGFDSQHENYSTALRSTVPIDASTSFLHSPSSPLMRKRSLELDDEDEFDLGRSPSSPSRRSFSSLPDLESDGLDPAFPPPSSPAQSIVALPGADTDDELLPPAPPNFIPDPDVLSTPMYSSPGRSLLLIDDPNDVPLPRSPSPEDFDLEIDESTDPELTKLYNLRKKSLAAERIARQQEARSMELGALGMRAEARRARKKEKERSKEVGALLRLKLTGQDSAGDTVVGESTSSRVIGSISQLVARMMFRRHETFRPLSNRPTASTEREHVRSSLSRSVMPDFELNDF